MTVKKTLTPLPHPFLTGVGDVGTDKQEVIEFFCALASHVGEKLGSEDTAHDCFCVRRENHETQCGSHSRYNMDEGVLSFIAKAVEMALIDKGVKEDMEKGSSLCFDPALPCPGTKKEVVFSPIRENEAWHH